MACHDKCKKIKMYYRLDMSPTDKENNASSTRFVCVPEIDTYRGIENRYMTYEDFVTYNSDLITFIGYRTPSKLLSNGLTIPALYNETININVYPYDENYISASANYIDDGSSFQTSGDEVIYSVNCAMGMFKGFKYLKIKFYNDGNPPGKTNLGPVRIVTIY